MTDLYKNIKKRRLELGMTQTELAEKTGYSDKSAIAKIEKGLVDLSQTKIMTFAKVLGVSPMELMGWDDEHPDEKSYYIDKDARELAEFLHENPDYRVLFDASRNVKKEDIQFVKEMIDRMTGKNNDDTGC